jgi:hypothetical protein
MYISVGLLYQCLGGWFDAGNAQCLLLACTTKVTYIRQAYRQQQVTVLHKLTPGAVAVCAAGFAAAAEASVLMAAAVDCKLAVPCCRISCKCMEIDNT